MVPGPPLDDDMTTAVRRALANGSMGGVGLTTDDCRKDDEELSAKGIECPQPPAERPYGFEAVMRDNSGIRIVPVETRPYTAEDFADR